MNSPDSLPRRELSRVVLLAILLFVPMVALAQNQPCPYDEKSLSFAGTPVEQARCLLRRVRIYGRLDEPLAELPFPLERLIGRNVSVSRKRLEKYLEKKKIDPMTIGGLIIDRLSFASLTGNDRLSANYFIIHDASTPNYLDAMIPPNINEANWELNDLQSRWSNVRVAHLFINRLGESITTIEFRFPLPQGRYGTKFARDRLKDSAKGLQLHIELIQPRRRDPAGGAKNDAIAAFPGFTEKQYERLALVYIAASVRRGLWMIPAFHCAIDAGIPDAHDDPQNFELHQWARILGNLIDEIIGKKKYAPPVY